MSYRRNPHRSCRGELRVSGMRGGIERSVGSEFHDHDTPGDPNLRLHHHISGGTRGYRNPRTTPATIVPATGTGPTGQTDRPGKAAPGHGGTDPRNRRIRGCVMHRISTVRQDRRRYAAGLSRHGTREVLLAGRPRARSRDRDCRRAVLVPGHNTRTDRRQQSRDVRPVPHAPSLVAVGS